MGVFNSILYFLLFGNFRFYLKLIWALFNTVQILIFFYCKWLKRLAKLWPIFGQILINDWITLVYSCIVFLMRIVCASCLSNQYSSRIVLVYTMAAIFILVFLSDLTVYISHSFRTFIGRLSFQHLLNILTKQKSINENHITNKWCESTA